MPLDKRNSSTRPSERTEWLIGYAGASLVIFAGLLSAQQLIFADGFGVACLIIATVGIPTSRLFRRIGRKRPFLNAAMLAATGLFLIPTLAFFFASQAPSNWQAALITVSTSEAYTAAVRIVAAVTAFRCFVLITRTDLTLSMLPGFSLILLVAIVNGGWLALPYFGAFCLGAGLLLSLDLRHRWRSSATGILTALVSPDTWWSNLRPLVPLAMVVAAASFVLARATTPAAGPASVSERFAIALARWLADAMIEAAHDPFIAGTANLDLTAEVGPLSETEMFRVTTSPPVESLGKIPYWRGNCMDFYRDGQWTTSRQVRRHRVRLTRGPSGQYTVDPGVRKSFQLGGVEVKQTFAVEKPQASILFGLAEPVAIRTSVRRLRMNASLSIECSEMLGAGDSYEVTSLVEPAPHRPGPRQSDLSLPPWLREACLQVPPLGPRVRRLAESIAGSKPTELARLEALTQYLSSRYQYSTHPPTPPVGLDPVQYFLFDSLEGYCTHYASALVLLCRLVGIPSRLVTGFASGRGSTDGRTWAVREKDAHAWVEAWIGGVGWVTADPTPAVPETPAFDPFAPLAAVFTRLRESSEKCVLWANKIAVTGWQAAQRHAVPVGVLVLSAALAALIRSVVRRQKTPPYSASFGSSHSVAVTYWRMCAHLRKRGLVRQPPDTPWEFSHRALSVGCPAGALVSKITDLYVTSQYGSKPAPTLPPAVTRQMMSHLRRELAKWRAGRRGLG